MGEAERAESRLGSVLRGKYTLDRVLGVGGMAVVYKATHRNQAEFAVKLLHPELSRRDDVRTRFVREGYAANSLKHPGAVLVVDDDVTEDGEAFLVMELLHGAEVEALWERRGGRLAVDVVLSIADQLLDVLAAAHDAGIVHRDIKPANLFITREGTLKVLDFGIARVKDAAVIGDGRSTGTGMLLGTPAFMAPEQALAKARNIDGQTDVWSVGATLFTLLSGDSVHEGENSAELMVRAATAPPRPLASIAPDVPPVVAELIDRALAFDKPARWPTATAMRTAVEQASTTLFGHPPSRDLLKELVSAEGLERAPTQRPPAMASSAETVSRAAIVSRPLSGLAAVASPTPVQPVPAPASPSLVGSTTVQPVSSKDLPASSPTTSLAAVQRGGRRALWAALAAAALVVSGFALAIVLHAPSASSRGAPAQPEMTPSQALSPAATPPAAVRATAAATEPSGAAMVAGPEPPTTSSARQGGVSVPPVAATLAHAGSASRPSAAKPDSTVPAAASAKTDCTPPYTLDSDGQKHFKPECFGH